MRASCVLEAPSCNCNCNCDCDCHGPATPFMRLSEHLIEQWSVYWYSIHTHSTYNRLGHRAAWRKGNNPIMWPVCVCVCTTVRQYVRYYELWRRPGVQTHRQPTLESPCLSRTTALSTWYLQHQSWSMLPPIAFADGTGTALVQTFVSTSQGFASVGLQRFLHALILNGYKDFPWLQILNPMIISQPPRPRGRTISHSPSL